MNGVNKVILIGRLGSDPEVKYFASGDAVCNLSVATSEKWKDKQSGEMKESTEWHKVVLFRRQAEVAGEYLRKGSGVYIEGKLKTRKWQDKQGNDRFTTEIEAREMQMVGDRSNPGMSAGQSNNAQASQHHTPPSSPAQANFPDDDIPF